MATKKIEEIVEVDANLQDMDRNQGDIGNWRPMLDGVMLPAVGVEDGVPEGNEVDVIIDDRDGPVVSYDSFGESRYIVSIDIPTRQRAVEEALLAGAGQVTSQSAANTQNTVGDPTTAMTTTYNGEEIYLLKIEGSVPYTTILERCGFAHINPDNFMLSWYRPSANVFADLTTNSSTVLSVTNRHKGTIEATGLQFGATDHILTYDSQTRYVAYINGGATPVPVKYIDDTLEDGDACFIVALAYEHSQLSNSGDYQIDQRVANSKRQQLTLYRPLGNSTDSRFWLRRIYPDVRLVGPPADSTGTGNNSLNVRRFSYRVERMRQPSAQSDYYYEQKVREPAA